MPVDLRHHGDSETGPGLIDFAVNVRGERPPPWLRERLAAALDRIGPYPSATEERAAREQVATRHGRDPDEVLLLSGAAEGFAMLARLGWSRAAVIHPSFTEPEFALRTAGVLVERVVLPSPYRLSDAQIPEDADVVVLGNPTNPTSILHPRGEIDALRRSGRVIAVDEAFADATPGEPESRAGESLSDVLVFRSLTKTFALAGLRCGYVLGSPELLARLAHGRAHWPLGTLQLEAVRACSEPAGVSFAADEAVVIAGERAYLERALVNLGIDVTRPATGSFLLIRVPEGERVRTTLREKGFALRRCDTFPGLTADHLRVAVRSRARVDPLLDALALLV